ncbi:MAG: bifunctional DNA-formamidopyrimidine glycosylase/DNA-(apurinic or apyrimidinic site) lyase [Verrucomicrobia bacterium]|jgi:formamidopyrimidine-DNA glycosylase|nr:bifunctional DNA-formamidopyrimidine glycosylase/DNA-(apurinic or apyrimidinic site) lyase [Verrucomicrobiota bacterium]
MPELPEVEVLVRHLAPLVRGRTIHDVTVRRARVLRPTSPTTLRRTLRKARILNVSRRAKYLVFDLRPGTVRKPFCLVAHLGMTGRIYLAPKSRPLPKHAAVVLDLGRENLIYEDPRYFGRFMLDAAPLQRLGPEPLAADFSLASWQAALRRSTQAIKVKLLDQSLIAGIGNIYASEALHWAAISPRRAARSLSRSEAARLRRGIRQVLRTAIRFGSTVPLRFESGHAGQLFYYGRDPGAPDYYTERLRVYDRQGQPCHRCGGLIRRLTQAGRSTYWCPGCQR